MSERHDLHQEEREDAYQLARSQGYPYDEAVLEAKKVLGDHDDGGAA